MKIKLLKKLNKLEKTEVKKDPTVKKNNSVRVIKANVTQPKDSNNNIKSNFSFKPADNQIPSSLSNSDNNNQSSKKIIEVKKITTNNAVADRSKNLLNQLELEVEDLKMIQTEENFRKKRQMLQQQANTLALEQTKKKTFENEDINIKDKSFNQNNKSSLYMSIKDLDQKKNDHRSKVEEIEKYFSEKKKICDYEMSAYSKLTDDYLLASLEESPKAKKRKDSASTHHKPEKRTFSKTLSQSLNRSKSSTGYENINIEEEEFVKRYKDFLARTHYLQDNFKDNLSDDDRKWDHGGVKSSNNRLLKRNEKRQDTENEYSYYSISADGLSDQDLSVDISYDKEAVKKKKKQAPQKIKRETKKQFSPFPELNSKLGFFRMIYSVLDKEKNNFITKTMVRYGLKLDLDILKDLGYLSHNSFFKNLQKFITKVDGVFSEEEFLFLIFDKIEFKALFMKYWRTYSNLIEDLNINVRHTNNADERNLSKGELSTLITKNQSKIINNLNNVEYLTSPQNMLTITYKDYKSFTDVYKYKTDIKFTIPKPFPFTFKNYDERKKETINYIIEERLRKEDEIINHKFKPNTLNRNMFVNDLGLENCIEVEKAKRKVRIEKYKEKVIQEMRPFSFYEDDEKRFKERLIKQCEPPSFVQFRANPVSWTSQIRIYHDIIKKEKLQREQRIKQRSSQLLFASKLPPRMEMHEKLKRERARSEELSKDKKVRPHSVTIRATPIPDFEKLQAQFFDKLEEKKNLAKSKPTDFKPFNFHEPKKDVKLRGYLDRENNPKLKNPKIRCNIEEIIERIQRKPKLEPATTKGLNMLMATRRKFMENKQKQSEDKAVEDMLRKEKQNKLKERVVNSKFIVDNAKALDEKKRKHQEDFKSNLDEQKNKYEQELARRLERVYNKPLMFETSTAKPEKFTLVKNMQDKLNNLLNEEDQQEGMEIEEGSGDDNENMKMGNNKVDTVEEEEEGENQEDMDDEEQDEMAHSN